MSIIGIDFGTTKSIAMHRGKLIRDKQGRERIPSLVLIDPQEDVFVGWDAASHPQRYEVDYTSISSIKRILGKENGHAWTTTQIQEIAALILSEVRATAQEFLDRPVEEAVIAIPANFDINQRCAISDAAEIAGIKALRLINEATAAAVTFQYGRQKSGASADETVLVFDFGGGTLDVSLVNIGEGICEVRSNAGDGVLGGDDFDQVIIDHIIETARHHIGISLEISQIGSQMIRQAAKQAKAELSSATATRIYLPGIIRTGSNKFVDIDLTLTRDTFEQLGSSLIKRAETVVEEALTGSEVGVRDIGSVLMLGGTSRIPAIRGMLANVVGKRFELNVEPETCVAKGVSLLADIYAGYRADLLLLDIVPQTLSVATVGDASASLIRKNTTIPTRVTDTFTTTENNQEQIEINIFEGEASRVSDNIYLGKLTLSDIPPSPKGVPEIEVTFEVDANRLLTASARHVGTGRDTKATLTAPFRLNDAQRKVLTRKVAAERERFDKRGLISQKVITEVKQAIGSETIHQDAAALAKGVTALLHDDSNLMTDGQKYNLREGTKLIADYVERRVDDQHIVRLMQAINNELEVVVVEAIVSKVGEFCRDATFVDWVGRTAKALYSSEELKRSMKELESLCTARFGDLFTTVHATGFEPFEKVVARLRNSVSEVLCFLLIRSARSHPPWATIEHLVIRADSLSSKLVQILAFAELTPERPPWRRGIAAAMLNRLMPPNPEQLPHFIGLWQLETDDEVKVKLRDCISHIFEQDWYAHFVQLDEGLKAGWVAKPEIRSVLREALIEAAAKYNGKILLNILGELEEIVDESSFDHLAAFLPHVRHEEYLSKMIRVLGRCKSVRGLRTLSEYLIHPSCRVRAAARFALDECGTFDYEVHTRFFDLIDSVIEEDRSLTLRERLFLFSYQRRDDALTNVVDALNNRK